MIGKINAALLCSKSKMYRVGGSLFSYDICGNTIIQKPLKIMIIEHLIKDSTQGPKQNTVFVL